MSVSPLDPRLSGAGYRGDDPSVHGCRVCGGIWVTRRTLDAVLEAAQAQASNLDPKAIPRQTVALAEVVVYRPCPRCHERMHRRNFGRYSGIVVDECSSCGTYFDAGEFEGILAFVRAGGLGYRERRDAEEARRELSHRRQLDAPVRPWAAQPGPRIGWMGRVSGSALAAQLELFAELLRWIGRRIRRRAR
jgi:Zn-finger nucleic acid-binding protein